MKSGITSLLIFTILMLRFFQGFAQDELTPVQWYESFFNQKTQKPVEEILKKNEDRLLEAIEIQDYTGHAKVLLELGLVHLTRTFDYEKALGFFIQSLVIYDSLDQHENKIFSYLAIASVFEEVGDYYKSAQFLEQALSINATLNNADIHVLILNELGEINASLGKTDEAFANYNEVLEYKDRVLNRKTEADALFNLAHLYTTQGEFAKAMEYHKKALDIRRALRDRMNESISLNDIGELYYLMKNTERALANHVAALEIYQSLDNKKGIATSYNNIGALYYRQKNYERAIANLQFALAAGRESQAQEQIRKSYEYLSLSFKEMGDYKKALEYTEQLLLINDFIQNDRNERQLLETQNRYVLDQKESQIERLDQVRKQREKEIAEQKKFRNILILLIALSFIVAALILYLYLLKRKSNRELKAAHAQVEQQNTALQKLNATKDKFFSILGHDLKGPLNSLTSFSQLLINYFDSLSKEEIQTLAKDLDKSLKNLFALLDNLLEWARSQTSSIDFTPEKFDINAVMVQNQELLRNQADTKQISLKIASASPLMVTAHMHSTTTVVRNLIANAIKFTPPGGTISLEAKKSNQEIIVSVADTGVGMSEEVLKKLFRIDAKHSTLGTANEKGTGLGLILCKDFVEKNGGRLWVESTEGQGSVFYFTVPI